MSAADEIASAYILRGVNVIRHAEHVRRETTGLLEALIAALYSEIIITEPGPGWIARRERLIRRLNRLIDQYYDEATSRLELALLLLARDESDFYQATMERVLGTSSVAGNGLLKREAQGVVETLLVAGGTLSEYMRGQATNLSNAVARQLRMSSMGESIESILARVFGRRTGRTLRVPDLRGGESQVPEFSGGVVDAARRHVNTVTTSATSATSQAAAQAIFEKNKPVERVMLSVILDQRTSVICSGRAGAIWQLPSGEADPESTTSEGFPGPPPYHLNCRSLLFPVLTSSDNIRSRSRIPEERREQVDGSLPQVQNLDSWLKAQTPAVQRQFLGTSQYNLYKQGKLPTSRLLERGTRPLTLQGLKRSY